MGWDGMGWTRVEDGGESEATTTELTEFIEKAKMGEITNQDIPKFAKMFKVRAVFDIRCDFIVFIKIQVGQLEWFVSPSSLFTLQDELTLDNISRSGLVNMCRYMGLPGYGTDNFLRFQLRSKLRAITQVLQTLQ